jgi:maltose/moltooligosaccharide transporter
METHKAKSTPTRHPAFLALPATSLGLALSVQVSTLSWLLLTRYNLAIDEIALVWAAGPVAGILVQLLIGELSDRVWIFGGRRRLFILLSAALSAGALIALQYLETVNDLLGLSSILVVAVSVTLLLDLSINVGLNPSRAIIADMTSPGPERSTAFVWMQTISGGVSVAAYGIGAGLGNFTLLAVAPLCVLGLGVLPVLLMREPRSIKTLSTREKLGLRQVLGSLAPLLPLIGMICVLAGAHLLGQAVTPHLLLGLTAFAMLAVAIPILRDMTERQSPILRKIMLAHALSWIGVYSLFVFLTPFLAMRMPELSDEDLGRVTATAFLAFNAVGAIAPLALFGPAIRRFRRVQVHACALLLMGFSLLAIGLFAHSPAQLWALLALAGIGWGAVVSLPFAILSDRMDGGKLGLILGLFNLSVVIPQLAVSFGLGALAATLPDLGLLFLIAGASLVLSATCWLRLPVIAGSSNTGRRL